MSIGTADRSTRLSRQWRGVLREYADRLDVSEATPIVTLGEGGTPLHPGARALGAHRRAGLREVRGDEPHRLVQGPRHDDGDLEGRRGTARRPSSAPPPATPPHRPPPTPRTRGITAAVLVPEGKIAMGKLSQAIAHDAQLLQVQGNFDDCLDIARELAANYPVHLVNSVNNDRIEGQKTAAFEVVEVLGDAPDFHFIPVGNAGNYTAYHRGYREELDRGAHHQAAAHVRLPGRGHRADRRRPRREEPRDHRHRHPHRQPGVVGARARGPRGQRRLLRRDQRRGHPGGAPHPLRRGRHLRRARQSAISVAGLLERAEAGAIPRGRDRRAHGHRPRPEGPAVGARRRRTAATSRPPSCRSTPPRSPRCSASATAG